MNKTLQNELLEENIHLTNQLWGGNSNRPHYAVVVRQFVGFIRETDCFKLYFKTVKIRLQHIYSHKLQLEIMYFSFLVSQLRKKTVKYKSAVVHVSPSPCVCRAWQDV